VQPIEDDLIVRALENACNNENLIFQVIQDLPYLYVYINRLEEQPLDYDLLSQKIFATITGLSLPDITGLGIYSRPCDLPDPDWQTFFDLSVLEEDSPAEDVSTPKPEPEIILPEPEIISPEPQAAEPKGLADYCFIRNKALLTTKILPPEPNIAKLVKFFDEQPENCQLELLSVLEVHLRTPDPKLGEPFDPEVQAWLGELGQLKDMDARNIAIWLSRYCLDPDQTMAAVTAVLTNKPLDPDPTPTTSSATSPASASTISPVAGGSYSGNSSYAPNAASVDEPNSKQGFQAGRLPKEWTLIISVGWFFVTLIVITLAMRSLDTGRIAKLACIKSSIPQTCALALQVTGEVAFEDVIPDKRFPFSFEEKQQAIQLCNLAAVTGSGRDVDEEGVDPRAMTGVAQPKVANSTEVLEGLLLVDLQIERSQPQQPAGLVRNACTFAKVKADQPPVLVGHDEIPADWPKTAYTSVNVNPENLRRAFGVFNIFITLGVGTLFTALALFIAAFLRLGIEVDSFEALGMAAFSLGLVETVTQFIPIFGILGWVAIQVLSLGVVSMVVKGFRVNWAGGYGMIALGVILTTFIRFILNLILFIFLASLVV
jgi:hypothetical protein